jgi:hypothetical protein
MLAIKEEELVIAEEQAMMMSAKLCLLLGDSAR